MLCQRITGRLTGCYIYGCNWCINPHGEGRGRGKFDFCGMVEAVGGGVGAGGAGVGAGGGVGGVPGLQGCKLQGCKVASISTIKEYLFTCFVVVCYWCAKVFLYLCGLVPFRGWWRAGGGGVVWWWCWWCGGAGGG